jgi:hypothetical protein
MIARFCAHFAWSRTARESLLKVRDRQVDIESSVGLALIRFLDLRRFSITNTVLSVGDV